MRVCPYCGGDDTHAVVRDALKHVIEGGCWCDTCGASWIEMAYRDGRTRNFKAYKDKFDTWQANWNEELFPSGDK